MVCKNSCRQLSSPLPAGSQPERGSGARAKPPSWSSLGLSQGQGWQEGAPGDQVGRKQGPGLSMTKTQSMLSPQAMPGQTLISAAVVNSLFM